MKGVDTNSLLCNSPEEVEAKVLSCLNTINVMAGLTLGAIAGVALDQIDVHSLPDDEYILDMIDVRIVATLYNNLGVLAVICQFCVCMYSTFLLIFVNSTPNMPELVYFYVYRGGRLFTLYTVSLFFPNLCVILMIVLASWIYQTTAGAALATVVALILLGSFHFMSMYYYARMFPTNFWYWASVPSFFTGLFWCIPGFKEDTTKFSKRMIEQAAAGSPLSLV